MLKKEMKKLFEKKEEKAGGYNPVPNQSSRPLMDWEIIFGRQIVLKDGSVDFTNKVLQSKKYIGFFFADFSNKSATSTCLPLANTLVQYYIMLKDLGVEEEMEVISVDINDSMNVTYSRYYLDFPWLMVDISNLLLRQSLIQDYYTSTTVPQLVLLNRFGEIVDSSTIEKIEAFLNDKLISLETIYPDRQSHDYEVYNSYNNEETIPALTNHLSTSRTLSAENNDRRQDSFEDNKNIIAPQTRPLSVDMTRSKPNSSDNGVTTSDRDSVRKSNNPLSKIVNSIYGEGGAVSTSSEQQQPARYSLQNASLVAEAKQDRRIELKPLATAITAPETVKTFQSASNDTVSSVDTIRIKQLLRQLPTLPKFSRGKTYVESAILFYIINARKEVDMLDIIINELQEQQKYYPSYKKDILFNNKKMIGYGIIDMKDSIRNYERIITKFTYNEHFPSFSLGYPSIKWEKDLITELHITHSHWEHRLQSLYYHEHDETASLLTQLQLQYQEEYWRYGLELLQWCKIERIEREAIARRFEFFAIVIVCVIGLCIPVIVGVVIGVYAK